MKSQRMSTQSLAKPRASNLRYPSIYNIEDLTALETSLGSTHRSRGTPSGPENVCENAPTSRNDFKINEFATKSYNLNSKELPVFPENLLETRESLDIGVERTEHGEFDDFSMIRSMPSMNKMSIVDRNSQKENMFGSYSKLYMSQNKKTMGSLKPLRELKITDRGQLSAASSYRTNGDLKVNLSNESSSIRQLRGDHQEPKGLDLDEDEENVNWKGAASMEIPKDRMLSSSTAFKPEATSVLRNIQNYRNNTPNLDMLSLSKPNLSLTMKKTKFQENVKDFVQKRHDENAKYSKPFSIHSKYGDNPELRKSAVIKGSTPIKPTILFNKLEGISRSTKRVDSSIHSSRIGARRDDLRLLKTKRVEKNCGDYFKNLVVFKNVLPFLDVNSLTRLTRVNKNFRMSENMAFIKKVQSKLIVHGLHKQEQYEFWNHRVDFDSLQQAFPMQYTINAHKKSNFERDILSDVDRTRLFNNKVAQRKESLLKILFAISNSMPKIGYVQGLNSIVAVFISQDLKDHEIYWLIKYILKKKKFDGILNEGFPMVQLLNYQLEIYTRHYLPEIVSYLGDRDLNLSYFTTQWFITMFSYDLELSQLIKVWNLFLLKGWKTVIKVSLALLWHFKDEILRKSADDLPFYLKNFLRERIFYVSEEALFKIAETFKVNNRILKTLEILYERSAPTNVTLFINAGHKPECKIASGDPGNKNSIIYKDVMEYLNEDIDHMRTFNKTKGNISNELEHYRSIQNFNVSNSLIVDKSSGPSLNRNTRSSLNILDDIQPLDRLNSSQTQTSSTAPENGFLQTLTGLGKRLKQILTPKNNPPFLPRKFSDVKIVNQEQEDIIKENKESLSERVDLGSLLVLDKANSKCESVSNSLDFSASSRSKDVDIGHKFGEKLFSEGRPFEFTLGNARSTTEVSSGRNAMLKSRQIDSPHNNAAQSVIYPGAAEYKHKRNSSMPYDQFGILTTFRNSRTSYFEQTSPNNLSLTESDNFPSARLAQEEIKDLRKSSSLGVSGNDKECYISGDSVRKNEMMLQKTYSLEERVSSYVNNKRNASHIINGPKIM